MQTIFATLPENPNIRVKLRVNNPQEEDDLFKRHFEEIGKLTEFDIDVSIENIRNIMIQSEIWKGSESEIDTILYNVIKNNTVDKNIFPEKESSPSGNQNARDSIMRLIQKWLDQKRNLIDFDALKDSELNEGEYTKAAIRQETEIAPPEPENDERKFIRELEQNLDQILRKALQPLFVFVAQLAISLNDTDVRKYYKWRDNTRNLEDMQSPIENYGNNRTFNEFFDNNKHLGNVIILYTIQLMRRVKKKPKVKEEPILKHLIGLNIASDNAIVGDQDEWRNWVQYADNRSLYAYDPQGLDISKWYYCALPVAAYSNILSQQVVAAMQWAVSDIWRFTSRRDFTIPLLVGSPDTRDIFALMVRNKYMITTGSAYSESISVGNGSTSKRFMTGPGYRARDRRASENLAGKHWFENVVLITEKKPNQMNPLYVEEFRKRRILLKLSKDYDLYENVDEFLNSVSDILQGTSEEFQGQIELDIALSLENKSYLIESLRRTELILKCYDLMYQELKYLA